MIQSSFRARLDAMLDVLRADPRIEILDAVVRPPATEATLAEAEAAVGMTLPAEMRRFYAAHDGVFVVWGLRGHSYPDYENRPDPFEWPGYDHPPGCINLIPVSQVMSPEWQETSHVNEEYDPDLQALVFGAELDPQPAVWAVCVDNFRKFNHGDLLIGPEPVMVVSDDHGADLGSSDYCSFDTYLDMTLGLFGADRYKYGLGIGWTRQPQRVDSWSKPTDLDTIVTALQSP